MEHHMTQSYSYLPDYYACWQYLLIKQNLDHKSEHFNGRFLSFDFSPANLGYSFFRPPGATFFLRTGITVIRFPLFDLLQPEFENTILFFQAFGVAQPIQACRFDGWQDNSISDIHKDRFPVLNLFDFLFQATVLVTSVLLVDQAILQSFQLHFFLIISSINKIFIKFNKELQPNQALFHAPTEQSSIHSRYLIEIGEIKSKLSFFLGYLIIFGLYSIKNQAYGISLMFQAIFQ